MGKTLKQNKLNGFTAKLIDSTHGFHVATRGLVAAIHGFHSALDKCKIIKKEKTE